MRSVKFLFLFGLCLCWISQGFAQWPKDVPLKNGGKITIYQPQGEDLKGDVLSGRAAISVRKTAAAEPVFGAVWFEAYLETDKSNRTATLTGAKITKAKFADSVSDDKIKQLSDLIATEVPKWKIEIPLDQLITSINADKQIDDPNLKNDPPKIYYETKATSLVLIDGDPKEQQDKDMKMDRVVNTPFLIVKNPDDKKYYLYAGGFWYRSSSVTSGYENVKSLSSKIKQLDTQVKENEKKNNQNATANDKPKSPTAIIVSTVPAELIQTEGEATYADIKGTSLLYATNTLDDIFKSITDQKSYILISGRWYSAASLTGPWTYVPSDKLPADFAKIPKGTEKDGVLVSVAGTPEAADAKIDAQVPQTAKVDRKTAKCEVTYDGAPKFTAIENTSLQLAENSNITVLKTSDGKYYAVQNGVWFISTSPNGPWKVSDDRPKDVDKIPPSNSAYNTKYVYIYDHTPDYVYMGYTPGYLGCYIYGPTVVYGTGFYYHPWYGAVYYPRPVTFGFGFSYNPWTGWNMSWGMSFNFGWFHMGFAGGTAYGGWGMAGGWFGPPAFMPPPRPWGWNGGYYGPRPAYGYGPRPNININRPVYINNNININVNNNNRYYNNNSIHNNNIYNHTNGVTTRDINRGNIANQNIRQNNTNRMGANGGGVQNPRLSNNTGATRQNVARPSTGQNNNVMTDRNGNVFQKDKQGNWQQRNNGNWQPANAERTQQLNHDNIDRSRGTERMNNFQNRGGGGIQNGSMPQSRPAPSRSMPSGGFGGRRR